MAVQDDDLDDHVALVDRFYDRIGRLRDEPEADPELFMREALELIVLVARARLAYVELRSDTTAGYVRGYGCGHEDLETIKKMLSSTIIECVLTTKQPVILDSALDDTRFVEVGSVKQNEIRPVIVFPVGNDPTRGVIYVQGQTGRTLGPAVQTRVANFARDLALVTDRLLDGPPSLERETRESQRRRILEALRRRRWNFAEAADELRIARSHLYRLTSMHGIKKPDH